MQRFVYFFGEGNADAGDELRHLVGGKGASLADMTKAQLNVPPGFTISAECCDLFYKNDRRWPASLEDQVRANLARLEELAGRTFGRGGEPLLVAVRSGAAVSMPGMMDTVLNVGLNPDCVCPMAQRTGNARGAWDAYRHFLAMFGHTVAGINDAVYAVLLSDLLRDSGKSREDELDAHGMMKLCDGFTDAYQRHTGKPMPTEPWDLLVHAVNAVFGSWLNDRAVTYRQHHKIDGLLGTAVTVQMMCPSEVSGIMFTANPVNPTLEQIIIESSYGLGEAIVLGKVTPDRFVLDKHSTEIRERHIGAKDKVITTLTDNGAEPVGGRAAASLSDEQVIDLARLGMRVEQYFKIPSDIEWALSQGRFYLLQARAIKGARMEKDSNLAAAKTAGVESCPTSVEGIRQEEIAAVLALAEPGGTVWSRYNLAEILPEPTPMTWAIVRKFMSGQGGFGQMYRDFGFDPDPALDDLGIFDLICGRVCCNLGREPRMQWRGLPFEHPFETLKKDPAKAIYPRAVFRPARAGWRFWFFLPVVFFRLWRSAACVKRLTRTFAPEFRSEIVPRFLQEVQSESQRDLSSMHTPQLVKHFHDWCERTLQVFGRESLKPTLLAGVALENLEGTLRRRFTALVEAGIKFEQPPAERAQAIMRELVMGIPAEGGTDLPEAIRQLAAGALDRATFLERFGHRASHEMELARPRWHEDPAAVDRLITETAAARGARSTAGADFTRTWERLLLDTRLPPLQAAALEREVRMLHVYLALREAAKHYLMQGYALIRRILVELDRRFNLDGGIFFLTPDELPRLGSHDFSAEIERRRCRRDVCLTIPVPQVLFSDDLDAIGRAVEQTSAAQLQGVPLSAGIAEGAALVIDEPDVTQMPAEPYILVCPSTDPAWVPLFVHARGLVMETGGVLSHGAIVAREFGLPAVAGLPEIHRRLRTGQRLRIDGATGQVNVLA
jgi:rifampicin phosphotransferase